MELIQLEAKRRKLESLFAQEPRWDAYPLPAGEVRIDGEDQFQETLQESSFPEGNGIVLSPEGFYPLKIGMRVRHPKFGEGRVRSVEGMDEDQKATILFQTVGSKRMKVRYAHLEILE
jgi:DNA helicase-2/ATP-dependent DNA helicase PcrA